MIFPCSSVYYLPQRTIFYCHFTHWLVFTPQFSSFCLTSQRMNNTTAIAGSNPTISYHRLSKAEGIAFSCVFTVVCFFIVAGKFLTMVLFALSKKLRKRSLFLVINMAASDLLRGFFQTRESQNESILFFLFHFCRSVSLASFGHFCCLNLIGEVSRHLLAL